MVQNFVHRQLPHASYLHYLGSDHLQWLSCDAAKRCETSRIPTKGPAGGIEHDAHEDFVCGAQRHQGWGEHQEHLQDPEQGVWSPDIVIRNCAEVRDGIWTSEAPRNIA